MEIPKEWREHATSWQMFLSGVTHPYFKSMHVQGESMACGYDASKKLTMPILSEIENAPDFGKNVLRYLGGVNLVRMESALQQWARKLAPPGAKKESTVTIDNSEPDFMDYSGVCYMACLDSALNTMDQASRQALFRLAVRDAAYLISINQTMAAVGPVRLMFTIYEKPESFRGAFPPGLALPALTGGQRHQLDCGELPAELIPAVTAAKKALKLPEQPVAM
jgi:hypothetical protein